MIVLSVSDVNKSYGTDVILENVSFHINQGEKVGIIGINGAGKTTLLNILSGEIKADSGNVFISKETTLGYLKQRDQFDPSKTVIQEVQHIFGNLEDMEKEIEELTSRISEAGEESNKGLWERLSYLQREFEEKGGYTYKSEIKGILSSMAFTEDYMDQRIGELSGGERTRLALACLLLSKPDILFLDEPTNHLDIGTLKWLEQYLKAYKGTLVLISHDRYFLDQITDHTVEIMNRKAKKYSGGYSRFAEKKKAEREAQQRAYDKQQKEIKHHEAVIREFKSRATERMEKQAKARQSMLSHIERIDKPEKEGKTMKLSFHQTLKSGNDVLYAEDLGKSFYTDEGVKRLFKSVSFDIKRGERISLVGSNGVGKTTLLKIIVQDMEPTEGYLRIGHNVELGYYDQGQQLLNDDLSVLEEIHEAYHKYTERELRTILGSFLFTGDMVFRKVGSLSGGEKARLSLLKLMMSGANVLVLDEPTNHLDIQSKEVFEDALMDYPGTVITVTHDRYFLNKVPDRILELTPDGIKEYLGKYDYYVEKKAEIQSGKAYLREMKEQKESSTDKVLSAAEERELKKKREAEERRLTRESERLESLIEALETEIAKLDEEMCSPDNLTDIEKLGKLDASSKEKKEELEEAMEAWEEVSKKLLQYT